MLELTLHRQTRFQRRDKNTVYKLQRRTDVNMCNNPQRASASVRFLSLMLSCSSAILQTKLSADGGDGVPFICMIDEHKRRGGGITKFFSSEEKTIASLRELSTWLFLRYFSPDTPPTPAVPAFGHIIWPMP